MNTSPIHSESSFDARKHIEELALQQAVTASSIQTHAVENLSSLTDPYAIASINTLSNAQTTLSRTVPTLKNVDAISNKCEAIQSIPKEFQKPIDALFFEIMKLLQSDSVSSLKTKELLLQANKEWQHTLEKELLAQAEKSRNLNQTSNLLHRATEAIAPASALLSIVMSAAVGVVDLKTIAVAALSGLFFIDSLCDDVAKRYVASILAKKDSEEAKAWLQRIQLFSSILSFGISQGMSQAKSLDLAKTISSIALKGFEIGTDWKKAQIKSNTIQSNTSLELSQVFSEELIKKWEEVMNSIFEMYRHQSEIQNATNKTCHTLFQTIS